MRVIFEIFLRCVDGSMNGDLDKYSPNLDQDWAWEKEYSVVYSKAKWSIVFIITICFYLKKKKWNILCFYCHSLVLILILISIKNRSNNTFGQRPPPGTQPCLILPKPLTFQAGHEKKKLFNYTRVV